MVNRHLRGNKIVRKKRRLPCGRTAFLYRKKKTSKPHCGDTGIILNGTLYGRKKDLKKYSHSEKRPTRYYGGVLSHIALKNRIIKEIYASIKN